MKDKEMRPAINTMMQCEWAANNVLGSTFDGCEWNPQRHRSATNADEHYLSTPARVIVGANGQWRLCFDCASLSHFKCFKVRKVISADRLMVLGRVKRSPPT